MVNPYQPPPARRREKPFFQRLRRGLTLAKTEYLNGLKREGFEGRDHLRSWLALIMLALIGLLISAWILAVIVIEIVAPLSN